MLPSGPLRSIGKRGDVSGLHLWNPHLHEEGGL